MKVNTFIAYILSKSTREIIAAIQTKLQNRVDEYTAKGTRSIVRAVAPDKLHMTLLFLGSLPPGDNPFGSSIPRECLLTPPEPLEINQPVHLELTRIDAFPTTQRPRAIWLGAEDRSGRTTRIVSTLRSRINQDGMSEIDLRPFVPHITIAYTRPRIDGNERRQLSRVLEQDGSLSVLGKGEGSPKIAAVERVALIQSIPTSTGTRYAEIDTVWL